MIKLEIFVASMVVIFLVVSSYPDKYLQAEQNKTEVNRTAVNSNQSKGYDLTAQILLLGQNQIIQTLLGGALAGGAIFLGNFLLDKYRKPNLVIDRKNNSQIVEIELTIFTLEHSFYPLELRKFNVSYRVNRVKVRNKSSYAAEDCKGALRINRIEEKICWNVPQERYKMTINARSTEQLDVCAYLSSKQDEVYKKLDEALTRIEKQANMTRQTENKYPGLELVKTLREQYASAKDIPNIISPTENGWGGNPKQSRSIPAGPAEIVITAKNGKSELAQKITILDHPDANASIIRFNS
jgi:hypothetical protein